MMKNISIGTFELHIAPFVFVVKSMVELISVLKCVVGEYLWLWESFFVIMGGWE